jgi:hypothetical protein
MNVLLKRKVSELTPLNQKPNAVPFGAAGYLMRTVNLFDRMLQDREIECPLLGTFNPKSGRD